MISKINRNIIIMMLVLSCILLFSLSPLFKSSYTIKSDNNNDEYDDVGLEYIFDPGQYIEYTEEEKEKEETTKDNLNKQVSITKPSDSIIINDKVKEDALAHLSDQLLFLTERIQEIERKQSK